MSIVLRDNRIWIGDQEVIIPVFTLTNKNSPPSGIRLHRDDTGLIDGEMLDYCWARFPTTANPYWTLPQAGERRVYSTQWGYSFPGDEALLRSDIDFENEGGDVDTTAPKKKKKRGKRRGHFEKGKFVRDSTPETTAPEILQRVYDRAMGGQKLSKVIAQYKIAPGLLCFCVVARSHGDSSGAVTMACLLIFFGIILLCVPAEWWEKVIDDGVEGVKGLWGRRKEKEE